MKRPTGRMLLPALAGIFALSAGLAQAETKFISAEGEYVWNPKASHYSTPVYAKEQTMSIKHDDGKTVTLSQDVTLADGKKINWSYDGAFDGKPHPGEWITIALTRVRPDAYANDYVMNDGTRGHEVATITAKRVTIRGASVDANGGKHPYVEVWDRVK